jgi:hypothetical protein
MMTNNDEVELLGRPHPHFAEGRRMPRSRRLEMVVWLLIAVAILAAIGVAHRTRMVVEVAVSGSISSASITEAPLHVLLVAGPSSAAELQVGLPLRVRIGANEGWGLIVQLDAAPPTPTPGHVVAMAAVLDADALRGSIPGQACAARVLVGSVSTLEGMWYMATNRALISSGTDRSRLLRRIPDDIRRSPLYESLKARLGLQCRRGVRPVAPTRFEVEAAASSCPITPNTEKNACQPG